MKTRRGLCLLLVLALLLAMIPPVRGIPSLAFVAVNDTIPMTLAGENIPFYVGGALYVPYTAFGASALGIYPSYSASDRSLALFDRSRRLVFDLGGGTVTDEQGTVQEINVIFSGGVPFLPVDFCAGHFDIQASGLTSKSGYQVVRFTTGSQVYDDNLFIERAENLISYRVSQYEADNAPKPAEPATPNPPTHRPTVQPPPQEDPAQEEPDEELPPANVCLAVVGIDHAEEAMEALSGSRQTAAFFLETGEILENGDLVRRIAAAGHRVGLRLPMDQEPEQALQEGNEALERVLCKKTLLALAPAGADLGEAETRYCIFRADDAVTLTRAAEAHGETNLLVCVSETLSQVLATLNRAEVTYLPLRETTQLS